MALHDNLFQRMLSVLLVAALCFLLCDQICFAKSTQTNAHSLKPSHRHHYSRPMLVPPPPAYTPSLWQTYEPIEISQAKKPHSYSKYIKYGPGYETSPPVVKPNKYVTYWGG